MSKKISNISVKEYKQFLASCGCKWVRTRGGHETWNKEGLSRQITFPNHTEPMFQNVIRNGLKTLGVTTAEFLNYFN